MIRKTKQVVCDEDIIRSFPICRFVSNLLVVQLYVYNYFSFYLLTIVFLPKWLPCCLTVRTEVRSGRVEYVRDVTTLIAK